MLLGDEPVGPEPDHGDTRDRLVAPLVPDDRPVLDHRTLTDDDRLAEPALGLVLLRERPLGVRARVLQVAKRLRAEDGVVGIELRDGVGVGGRPGARPTGDPGPGGSLGFHGATLTEPAP